MYQITPYSFFQAKKLKVQIRPSKVKGKKIDVFKNGKKLASIGAIGYFDYPTYAKKYGLKYANFRRRLYHMRHNYLKKPGTAGYYAAKILW